MLTKLTLLLTAAAAAILGTQSQDLKPTTTYCWSVREVVTFVNPNQPPAYIIMNIDGEGSAETLNGAEQEAWADVEQQILDTGYTVASRITAWSYEIECGGESNLDYGDDGWEYSVRVWFRDQTQLIVEAKDFWTEKCPDAQYPTPLACQLWCYENIHDQIREWEIMTGWTAVRVRLKWDQPKTCD